ncbi:response regulator transcription factor [Burkholderia ubonensis]|uniref:LuxR family transcriptional regulator n=1 Tax=Burkholderia ubonensis TaxID=101571 RepID=A0A102MYL1_9BURK|nr:response regulator transcription factor [Burkholderia ubonensis]AOI68789.1 LuxR family transcriptional regulator [Burkholderia ubonensis]KUZ18014.1 LuxR family transcriptional regulator [Burkholderia ubonensis]KUZ32327.1 LuxR family transcriptional regulator [Burkholderia ubonensis]KUZ38802.1 LuxR family transcriptional regulator [Burkholderia ubonensis]KUZ47977.1 LuxR family transcriptional regulator [Burkholderia ubonensis]
MSNVESLIRVVVADDHPIVLRAVTNYIDSLPGFRVAASVSSGSALLATLKEQKVDLVVTDFAMQQSDDDKDGLRLISHLIRMCEHTPVVVFTMLTNTGLINQLCRMGVAGLVGKEEEIGELGQVCVKIVNGATQSLSPGMAHRLAVAGSVKPGTADFQALTPKELEVVRLFSTGVALTEIARILNRSLGTVSTQKRSAMRKLHVETNVDLINCAREQGLL